MGYDLREIYRRCREAYIGVDALIERSDYYLLCDKLFGGSNVFENDLDRPSGNYGVPSREMYIRGAPYYNIFAEDVNYARDTIRTENRDIERTPVAGSANPPELLDSFLDRATPNNCTFDEVIFNIFQEILIVGSAFVFLDPDGETNENIFEIENRLIVRYVPIDAIVDYAYDDRGNLEWVRFYRTQRELSNGRSRVVTYTYDILSRPYRVIKTAEGARQGEETVLTIRNTALQEIPGGIYGSEGIVTTANPPLSPFYDICQLGLNLYQLNAIATFNAAKASFLVPVYKRDQASGITEGKNASGSRMNLSPEFIEIDSREDLMVVEVSGDGIRTFLDHVKNTMDITFSKTISPRANDLRSNTSGRSVNIAMGRTRTVLNKLSNGIDKIQTDILNKFLTWYDISLRVEVVGRRDFELDTSLETAERTETEMRSQDQAGTR